MNQSSGYDIMYISVQAILFATSIFRM